MKVIEQLRDIPKLAMLALMVLGFLWFWPIGLAVLAYMVVTGALGQRININIGPWASSFWSTGNMAFDEHRADILKQLKEEQDSFGEFVTELEKAKDKAEFDQFMSSRQKKKR